MALYFAVLMHSLRTALAQRCERTASDLETPLDLSIPCDSSFPKDFLCCVQSENKRLVKHGDDTDPPFGQSYSTKLGASAVTRMVLVFEDPTDGS